VGKMVGERWIDWAERYYTELGKLKALRWILLCLGQSRLGPLGPEALASVQTLSDVERLGRMIARVHSVADWQALLETP
jgi:hypothetical protein